MTTQIKYNAGDIAPNHPKASNTDGLCMECGRKVGKNPLHFEVNTSWEIIVPNSDDANTQGCWAIGSECAKKFAPNLLIGNLLPSIQKAIQNAKVGA
jgi:hypothetical protein